MQHCYCATVRAASAGQARKKVSCAAPGPLCVRQSGLLRAQLARIRMRRRVNPSWVTLLVDRSGARTQVGDDSRVWRPNRALLQPNARELHLCAYLADRRAGRRVGAVQ